MMSAWRHNRQLEAQTSCLSRPAKIGKTPGLCSLASAGFPPPSEGYRKRYSCFRRVRRAHHSRQRVTRLPNGAHGAPYTAFTTPSWGRVLIERMPIDPAFAVIRSPALAGGVFVLESSRAMNSVRCTPVMRAGTKPAVRWVTSVADF